MAQAEIGLIGLGTMGAALALNIAEKGFPIAVWNRTTDVTHDFHKDAGDLAPHIVPTDTLQQLVAAIRPPRAIILMVPAGPVVDDQIAALRPLLGPEDVIIDAGNAEFHDTERRAADAARQGVPFIGMGVSGGEEGARHGPSIMGGGPRAAWDRVAPVLEAISAKFEGTPCATWMGPGGAGHFVKMVHNGIEYADMQMIAETLRRDARRHGPVRRADRPRVRALERRHAALLPHRDLRRGRARDRSRHGGRDARRHPRFRGAEGHRPLDRHRGPAPRHPGSRDRGRRRRPQRLGPPRTSARPGKAATARPPPGWPTGRFRSTIWKRR